MHLRVLGPLELAVGEELLAIRRGRPRRLLLALLVRAGEAVAPDVLIEELWSDDIPQNAGNALQIMVSYLRKVLAADADGPRIETVAGGYRLRVDRSTVDSFRFEEGVAQARVAPDHHAQLELVEGVLAEWRGTPLAEAAYDDFAQGEITRLHQLRIEALELRVDALLRLGRHPEAVGLTQQLVLEHPLHERFHAQLMRALYGAGRQADALRAFDAARTGLVEELGLDPGPELVELHAAILRQDAKLLATSNASFQHPAAPAVEVAALLPTLPARRGSFVGPEEIVDRVGELVRPGRAVVLTGPGGAGKTRLALEVAHRSGGPVWWVDLSGVEAGGDAVVAIAGAIGAPTPPTDAAEAVAARLGALDGVLVLDTCEHVLASVSSVIDTVLRSASSLAILATSRRPLGVAEELSWPVAPLGLPAPGAADIESLEGSAAVALFCARAADARPGFTLTEANAGAVARIVLLLDGLPLALELAAAHAGSLSPAMIVKLLEDRLRLVSGLGARTQSLRAAVEWSFGLLEPDEAVFLTRLSTFAGSFGVDAAVLVAGDGLDTDGLELLLSLVRQSLVAVDDEDRFRLLDTIRTYAAGLLQDDDARDGRDRLARWCADMATEADRSIRGADAEGWIVELRRELPNVRASLAWAFGDGPRREGARLAASMSWFWAIEGLFAEADRWLDLAGSHAGPDASIEAALLTGRAVHAASLGRLDDALACTTKALEVGELDESLAGVALLYHGVALWGLGRLDDAAEAHDRAIAHYRGRNDEWGLALGLILRSRTGADRDEDVDDVLEAALSIARRVGDPHVIALALEQRARAALRSGDRVLAAALAAESLERNESVGYDEGVVASLYVLGLSVDDAAEGRRHLTRGLRLAVSLEHPGALAEGLEAMASLVVGTDAGRAAHLLGAAEGVRDRSGVPRSHTQQGLVAATDLLVEEALGAAGRAAARTAGRLMDVGHLLD